MESWHVVSGLLTRASVSLGLYREMKQHLSSDLRDWVWLIIGVAEGARVALSALYRRA